jgi:hypothetical protein
MKLWQKVIVIFVGCGISAVLTFLTTQFVTWSVVYGGLQIAVLATVSILTGWQPKTP